jgi:hypothetical protein
VERVDRVRQILATRGLTLYQVSRRSAERFGRSSAYYIPHNLYYDLDVSSRCPSIEQFVALSQISDYRLSDWLAVFGLHLDQIPRLQSLLPRKYTVFLDSSVYDENAWIPWFSERHLRGLIPGIAPLAQLVLPEGSKRAREVVAFRRRGFLYAKIGEEDLLSFPDLLPGSIVRIDTQRREPSEPSGTGPSKEIFLVEHEARLYCGRLQRSAKDRLILCSSKFPFHYLELSPNLGAQVRGVVDGELRSLISVIDCTFVRMACAPFQSAALVRGDAQLSLKELLRFSRLRTGISFREASNLSRRIADMLGDSRYFTAPGTLSDYETLTQPPRQVQKVISLCTLYCMGFWDFLRASGLGIGAASGEAIPDEMIPRVGPLANHSRKGGRIERAANNGSRFWARLLDEWEEIPLFARDSLPYVSGLKDLSLSDVFWVGGDHNPIHPYLANATFAVINRRIKKPERKAANMLWEQPLYVLLLRDGTFVCGACTLEDGMLLVHPYPNRPLASQKLRNQIDAEVIGQVTAIVRRLI